MHFRLFLFFMVLLVIVQSLPIKRERRQRRGRDTEDREGRRKREEGKGKKKKPSVQEAFNDRGDLDPALGQVMGQIPDEEDAHYKPVTGGGLNPLFPFVHSCAALDTPWNTIESDDTPSLQCD